MGWGDFSNTAEIVAAKVPEQPDAPTTTIDNIYVRIIWTDPYLNSSPIISYKLFIANIDGAFAEDLTYCNGANEPILSQRYCELPMTALRTGTYELAFDTLVQAKV
jgi:hypothetical protein